MAGSNKSIFNDSKTVLKNSLKMDGSCISLRIGNNADSLVMQNARLTATRQPATLWEIGSNNFYIIDARPSGTADLTNVVGPTKSSLTSMIALGDVCKDHDITLTWNKVANCQNNDQVVGNITLIGCVLANVGLTAATGSVTVAGSWGVSFADMLQNLS